MTIDGLSIPYEKIKTVGGQLSTAQVGHHFELKIRASVKKPGRVASLLGDQKIEIPSLQWNERIEWFEYQPNAGQWDFVGEVSKDMYRHNPASNTFKIWHSNKFYIATDASNNPPSNLRVLKTDDAAKEWISNNGFSWDISIRDVPAMGVRGGTGGGGGDSLAVGDSRRRVIYFDLGFAGQENRVRLVQILETMNGKATICHLIRGEIQKATVDHELNLERWRFQLASGHR